MTKYIYIFYILLGVCLLAGFGSAFGSGQEHDVVRTVDLENSAVALCNISESNNGQEKKEINNESYHFYKVGIGGTATWSGGKAYPCSQFFGGQSGIFLQGT